MSNNYESSEGAPGRPAIVLIGVLLLAAIASVWVMYTRMPPSYSIGVATATLGYTSPALTAVPRPVYPMGAGYGNGTKPQVELLFGFDTFDHACYLSVVSIVRDALAVAAPGAAISDQDSEEIDHQARSIPPADDWRFGFIGAYEDLDDSQIAGILDDIASSIVIQLVTPAFADFQVVDIQFNYSDGRLPKRWRLGRVPTDATKLEVTSIAP